MLCRGASLWNRPRAERSGGRPRQREPRLAGTTVESSGSADRQVPGREAEGGGWRILAFDRPPPRLSAIEVRADGGHGIGALTVPPWRLDASWRQLVALSWPRMQPFVGTVVLEPLPGSRGRRRYWQISYRSAEPARRGETTSFRLRSTGLYRPASTRRAQGRAAAASGDR